MVREGRNVIETDDYEDLGRDRHPSRNNIAAFIDGRAARRLPVEVMSILWLGNDQADDNARRKTLRGKIKEVAWDKMKIVVDDRQLDYGGELAEHMIDVLWWCSDLGTSRDREIILRQHWEANVRQEIKAVLKSRRHSKQTALMVRV